MKKVTFQLLSAHKVLLSAVLVFCCGLSASAQKKSKYDVNGDGKVDIVDATTIIGVALGNIPDEFEATPPEGVEAVDLGLPSGTKWANMNVGATSPQDIGLYFAWGETVGYTADTSDGRSFNWTSYKWMNKGQSSSLQVNKYQIADGLTKGCWYDAGGNFIGDGKTVLDLADDAARANWGGDWRMPTPPRFRNCWTTPQQSGQRWAL